MAILMCVYSSAITLTFNIEHPESVVLTIDDVVYPLEQGPNTLDFTPLYYSASLTIKPVDGWKIELCASDEPTEYGDLWLSGGYIKESIYTSQSGRSYTINTTDVSALRTASATINIADDAEKVVLYRDNMLVELVQGENTIKFQPDSDESEFDIRNMNYKSFYSITHNGEPVSPEEYTSHAYTVSVSDGDRIDIQVSYPDVDVPLSISSNIEAAINFVTINGDDADWKAEGFTAKAGSNVYIAFNKYYNILGATVNGISQPIYGSLSFELTDQPTTVVIEAENYPEIHFSLNIDDPEHISVHPGQSADMEAYVLEPGDNALTVSERIGKIYIVAAKGCFIESITDGEGNPLELSWDALSVTENMTVNITTGEIVDDSHFVVYFNGVNSRYSKIMWQNQEVQFDPENEYYAGNNYWVFPFCSNFKGAIEGAFDADPDYDNNGLSVFLYKGTELLTSRSYISRETLAAEDATVFYAFVEAEAPAEHTVTITADEAATPSVEVYQDILTGVDSWQDGIKAFHDTLVSIKAGEGCELKLDGDAMEPDENGCYNITVTADHQIDIVDNESSAILNKIGGDEPHAVYNLQGIRLDKSFEDLPAGIYIVGGKKVRR